MLDRLIPPDNPERITRWRYFVAGAVLLLVVNAFAGRVGFYGFGAFASADELQDQTKKIDRVLTLQIAENLRELKKEYCRSNGSKAVLEGTIEDYQQQYREITGKRYPLPECEHEDDR